MQRQDEQCIEQKPSQGTRPRREAETLGRVEVESSTRKERAANGRYLQLARLLEQFVDAFDVCDEFRNRLNDRWRDGARHGAGA
jgi:hypothetical protein